MTDREFFLQRWEQEYPIFLRVFWAVPHDKLDFRPHERSRSAAELIWHMVCEEQVGEAMIDTLRVDWKESPPTLSLDEMIAAYEKAHSEVEWRLKKLDDKTWNEAKAKLLVEGQVPYEAPLREMFWGVLFEGVHHRGQLSTYIRPMGGKVPVIYGPSADDKGA